MTGPLERIIRRAAPHPSGHRRCRSDIVSLTGFACFARLKPEEVRMHLSIKPAIKNPHKAGS